MLADNLLAQVNNADLEPSTTGRAFLDIINGLRHAGNLLSPWCPRALTGALFYGWPPSIATKIFQNYKNVKLAKLATKRLISSDSEIPSAFQNETRLADAGFRGIASLVHKL